MFKIIKYIADLVRQNNNYQRAISDIILKLHKPDNYFVLSDIDEVSYIIDKIDKLQKENAKLKERLNKLDTEGIRIKR